MLTGAIPNIPHVMEDNSYEENECILYRSERLSKNLHFVFCLLSTTMCGIHLVKEDAILC